MEVFRNALEPVPEAAPGGTSHRKVRARVEYVFARMQSWKILRDCRLKGDGVHHAMLGIARLKRPGQVKHLDASYRGCFFLLFPMNR